jgi:hypothetical protein
MSPASGDTSLESEGVKTARNTFGCFISYRVIRKEQWSG